jgi:hypothetical protein
MTLLRRRNVNLGLQVPFGLQVNFESEGQFLSVANNANFNFGLNSFSFAFYVQKPIVDGNVHGVFTKREGSNFGYISYFGNNNIFFRMYNGTENTFLDTNTLIAGERYYVVFNVIKEASGWTYQSYVDNVQGASVANANNNSFDGVDVFRLSYENLFSPGSPTGLDSYFYDFKVFLKALDNSERMTLGNSKGETVPASAQGALIADWRFNEGSGLTANDETTNNDITLNSYTVPQYTKGSGNYWIDKNDNPIL